MSTPATIVSALLLIFLIVYGLCFIGVRSYECCTGTIVDEGDLIIDLGQKPSEEELRARRNAY